MSSLAPVNSINITSGPTVSNFLPASTGIFSAQVAINGNPYQTAFENIQDSAVPTAIDTYMGVILEAAKAAGPEALPITSISIKVSSGVATGVGLFATAGFVIDLTGGISDGEDPVQATVTAITNVAVSTGVGAIAGVGAEAIIGGITFLTVAGTAPVWVPAAAGVLAATGLIVGGNALLHFEILLLLILKENLYTQLALNFGRLSVSLKSLG